MPNIKNATKDLNHCHRLLTKPKDPGQSSRGVRDAHPLLYLPIESIRLKGDEAREEKGVCVSHTPSFRMAKKSARRRLTYLFENVFSY